MHACVDTVEYLPAPHAMQVVPPFRASESVTEPAAQLAQVVVELGEYCPAAHDVHLVPEDETTESLEPAVTTDPEVHASHSTACAPLYFPSGQAAHATVDDAEKWPAAHDVHRVPPALAAVSVTEPAKHDTQSLALVDPTEPTNSPATHPMHADDAIEPVAAT